MTPALLQGFLWLARTGIRAGRRPVRAGHGYADPAYRPPELPFVSVTGPLAVSADPNRDVGKPREATFLTAGHLLGEVRPPGQTVPAGTLSLRFDGDAGADVAVAAGVLDQALAAQVQLALRAAAFTSPSGTPITDAARLAELALTTCRWDGVGRRLAVSSGRRGPLAEDPGVGPPRPSSVEVRATTAVASALGLTTGTRVDGRLRRQKLPLARAVLVDVRLDLWAASQVELAAMADHLGRFGGVQRSLVILPGLLAADAEANATTLRLLPAGQPVTPNTIAALEATDGPGDRACGRNWTGPAPLADPPRFALTGTNTLRLSVNPTPLIPDPRDLDNLAPGGVALSVFFQVEGVPVQGQTITVASLNQGAEPVLRLEVAFLRVNNRLVGEVTGTATFRAGATTSTAITRWQVPVADDTPFQSGLAVHAAVLGARGTVELSVNGQARPDDQPDPQLASGAPIGGPDQELVLGNPAGNPLAVDVQYAYLYSQPVGPVDERLRGTVLSARQLAPGQRLRLAPTADGITAGGDRQEVVVMSVDGDVVTVDPPLADRWARGRTIVFADELFFQITDLKRRDDLLNQLYRLSADFRVAAMLQDGLAETSAPLAEVVDVEVEARTKVGVRSLSVVGAPGTRASG